jgi:hypothetical protein
MVKHRRIGVLIPLGFNPNVVLDIGRLKDCPQMSLQVFTRPLPQCNPGFTHVLYKFNVCIIQH